MSKVPSLKSLHVFCVSARLLSFTSVARELNMTQSAVSQQIKQLEECLGVALFVRCRRGVSLSCDGDRFFRKISPSLVSLEVAVREFNASTDRELVNILVERTLLLTRFLPRLSVIQRLLPGNPISLESDDNQLPQEPDPFSLTIRLASGPRGGDFEYNFLAPDSLIAVCAPKLLADKPVRNFQDLSHHQIITVRTRYSKEKVCEWSHWCWALGQSIPSNIRPTYLSNSFLALEAAAMGQGIALARSLVAAPSLASGRLVRVFRQSVQCRDNYFFVCHRELLRERRIAQFLEWIRAELKHANLSTTVPITKPDDNGSSKQSLGS
jgi:LysR family transcriptional regulator, glycine cleavage system transcriptional activator